jgi:hypothetical protein
MPIEVPRVEYLRVIGRLYPDRRLVLRPGYLTARPPWTDIHGESPLLAVTLDERGDGLGRYPLRLYDGCAEPSGRPRPQAVRAFVPLHPRTRRVEFHHDGAIVHELARRDEPPRVELRWQPSDRVGGREQIAWAADEAVQFFLRYSRDGGETWDRIGSRTEDLEQTVDFDDLPGGDRCMVAVVATNGIDTTIVTSPAFEVESKACVAMVFDPVPGATITSDVPVLLRGQGFWREDGRPELQELTWHLDDAEEPIATGRRVEVRLPDGQHTIVLRAGAGERAGRAEVTVTVH